MSLSSCPHTQNTLLDPLVTMIVCVEFFPMFLKGHESSALGCAYFISDMPGKQCIDVVANARAVVSLCPKDWWCVPSIYCARKATIFLIWFNVRDITFYIFKLS